MCVCSLFIQPLKALHDFTNKLPHFIDALYPHIEPYAWPAASISQTWTIWIVLLVTVDRYVAVCLPLSRHLRSMQRTKMATAAILILAVLYNVPLFLEREVKHAHSACAAFPAMLGKTALASNSVYFFVYKTLCFFAFRSGGPLVTLVYLNARLYRALRLRRRRLTSRARIHNSVTMTLVAVVSVFIVCELPDAVIRLMVAMRNLVTSYDNDVEGSATVNVDAFITVHSHLDKLINGQSGISSMWMLSYIGRIPSLMSC